MLRVISGGLDRLPADDVSAPIARGRTLILIAALLAAGLVYINVGALEAGDGFGRYSQRVVELQRENTQLRARTAQLGSTDRIQKRALELGLIMPVPEQFTFVRSDGGDPLRAVRTYTEPSTAPVLATGTGPTGVSTTAPAGGTPAAAAPAGTPPAAAAPTTSPGAVPGATTGAGSPGGGTNPAAGGL